MVQETGLREHADDASPPLDRATRRRMAAMLVGIGGVGVATLALVPFDVLIGGPPSLRWLLLIQPTLIMIGAVFVGLWLAPKVGLDSPLIRAVAQRRAWQPVLRRQIGPALLAGGTVAALLVGYGWITRDLMAEAQGPLARLAGFEMPIATKLFYGGIVEELITRWGLLSLIAWVAWRISARLNGDGGVRTAHVVWAIALAALLFAAGHLPLLSLLFPAAPPWLVGVVLVGNALPGALFGWLYWRFGLESAMIAHAFAHLIATVAAVALA